MEPMFFGPQERRLFGVRFEPVVAPRRTAILICPSWGMEYMRSYRAVSTLGKLLAEQGFETLRLDYSSTGDSEGRTGEARLPHWMADIKTAVRELTELSGQTRIALLGVRLGAQLALQATLEEGVKAEHLIQWDMPINVAHWLDEIRQLEAPYYENKNRYRLTENKLFSGDEELMGMPMDKELEAALRNMAPDISQTQVPMTRLLSADQAGSLPGEGALILPDNAYWQDGAWITTPWNPIQSIRQIAQHLGSTLS
tara:strand:- start:3467 stop:4231 length:765 start_codon:yes stop_codon:yes gene_type:complete